MSADGTVQKLIAQVGPDSKIAAKKVTIVGTGRVGMAAAFAIMNLGIFTEIALIDVRHELAQSEMLDLMHCQGLVSTRCNIVGGQDFALSSGSKICVLTAGAHQADNETRLNLVQKNVVIFRKIIPEVLRYSPHCVLVIVANPSDIMAWIAWKMSGLPRHRVIGTGTMLETSRFRSLIADRFGVDARDVQGFVVGENGEASVPIWSSVSVAGMLLRQINHTVGEEITRDPEKWDEIHKQIIQSTHVIIDKKGYACWSLGLMVSKLCEILITNRPTVITVSSLADGFAGVKDEVFLSQPTVLSDQGVTSVLHHQSMTDCEKKRIQQSAAAMKSILDHLDIKLAR